MTSINIDIKRESEIDPMCGTKAMTLVELKKINLPIPDFYAVSSACFEKFCEDCNVQSIMSFYKNNEFNERESKKFVDIDACNDMAVLEENENTRYMVRSSAIPTNDVDLKIFASMISGAFESYMASSVYEVMKMILEVWKSVYLEKAYNQCRIFSKEPIISGIGVLIQKYVEPVISGVAHTEQNTISVNWLEGHLSKIVSGQVIGNSVKMYKSLEQDYILRGIEKNILLIKENNYEMVFQSVFDIVTIIKQYFSCEQEVEWVYDGKKVWIVQAQPLIV